MIPIYAIHREPKIWGQDAEQLRPGRWLQASPEQQALQAKAFMPFGDGPRNCPGAKFALQEAKLALFQLVQNFDFTSGSSEVSPTDFKAAIVSRPARIVCNDNSHPVLLLSDHRPCPVCHMCLIKG